MELFTERLLLRPFSLSDAEELYRIASDPSVGPAAGWAPHKNTDESRHIIRTLLQVPETYAVTVRQTGELIGCISLLLPENSNLPLGAHEAELGAWIGTEYQRKGYVFEAATELLRHAFEDLDLSRVYGSAFLDNEPSARLQEKLGFRYRYTREKVWWEPLQEYKTIRVQVIPNPKYQI